MTHFIRPSSTLFAFLALALLSALARAQGSKEDDYYKILRFPVPEYMSLEAGGLEWMPDGKLAISTRRGDIYLLDQPLTNEPEQASFSKYAGGLHDEDILQIC